MLIAIISADMAFPQTAITSDNHRFSTGSSERLPPQHHINYYFIINLISIVLVRGLLRGSRP